MTADLGRMVVERGGKWHVMSEDGSKHLGGPYDTKAEAEKRIGEIEYFKHADRMDAMSNELLNRASVDIGEANGRTLSGIAMPWDKSAMVQDLVHGRPGPKYLEAFAPASTDKSRQQHATFPVFANSHDPATEPIGVVTFSRSHEALMFEAPLSATPRADTFLELAKDGAARSVSIQFRPVQATRRSTAQGPLTYRTEVALRHLALVSTGYGQYEDAQVQSIRMELDDEAAGMAQAADAAIDAAAKCLDPGDDDYNIGQAQACITAAQLALDALLAKLGAVDADDVPAEAMAMQGRMELIYSTVARRRIVERHSLPTFEV